MPSMQHTFNKVYRHLSAQRRPAVTKLGGQCLYRKHTKTGDVLKCAIGCLIPDSKYKDQMEGKDVEGLFRWYGKSVRSFLPLDLKFYEALQQAHDDWSEHNSIKQFRKEMKEIASTWKLDASIVK